MSPVIDIVDKKTDEDNLEENNYCVIFRLNTGSFIKGKKISFQHFGFVLSSVPPSVLLITGTTSASVGPTADACLVS